MGNSEKEETSYDGQALINFTQSEGLEIKGVWGIYREPDGALWFGEW